MPDQKITDLAALTGAAADVADLIEVVDVSDTSMAATGTNKKITLAELVNYLKTVMPTGGGAMMIADAPAASLIGTNQSISETPSLTVSTPTATPTAVLF